MSTNTIQARGDYERYEAIADGAVTPGNLVEYTSAGKVKNQTNAALLCEAAIAVENGLYGKELTVDYADEDLVQYNIQRSGNIVYVHVADGQDIAIGDLLVSNGDGKVKERVAEVSFLFTALEACDMTGSSGADPSDLCRVRVR